MTIRFLRDYQGYPSGSEVSTLSTREENIAIAAGAATRTLGDQQLSIYPSDSAGGVRPENGPVRLSDDGTSLVSGDGKRFGILGAPNNNTYAGFEISTFYNRPSTDYQVVGAGSAIATSTAVSRTGSQTLKVTCNRGSAAGTDINALHAWTSIISFAGRVGIWVYVPDYTLLSNMILKVSHGDATYTNGAFQTYSFADGDKKFNGWHFVAFNKAEFTGVYGTPDWTAEIDAVRLTITQNSATAVDVYLDVAVAAWRAKPKLFITADDGYRSWFTLGLPILDSLGLKCTASIIGAQVDLNSTWVTSAQLESAYANGHDLCVHGATQMSDASFTSDAVRLADIRANRDFLTQRGYTRGANFYVWPNGVYQLVGAPDQLINLISGEGFVAARGTTTSKYTKYAAGFPQSKFLMPVIGPTGSDAVSTFTGLVDNAITYGDIAFAMYHEILSTGASGATQRNFSDFQRDMEYVAAKRDAGLLDVVTVSDVNW